MKLKYLEHINESEVFSGGAFTGIGVGGPSTNGFAYSIYMEHRNDLGFKPNELCTDYTIQIGSIVKGKERITANNCEIGDKIKGYCYNNPDEAQSGIVERIIKNPNGNIQAIQILSDTEKKKIYLSPDYLIKNPNISYTGMVRHIYKNADGSIEAVEIMSKNQRALWLSPNDILLMVKQVEDQKPKYTIAPNYMVGGQLY